MPTPGVDIEPFDSILNATDGAAVKSLLGGAKHVDKVGTAAYPGGGETGRTLYARMHNRIVSALGDLVDFGHSITPLLDGLRTDVDVLANGLTTTQADLVAEAAARLSADTTLTNALAAEIAARAAADAAEAAARAAADAELSGRIDVVSATLTGRVNIASYGAVADGTAAVSYNSLNSTDNYDAIEAARLVAKSLNLPLGGPAGAFDLYLDSDVSDTTAGKRTQIRLDWPGAAFIGAGRSMTTIRGKTKHLTPVGRVASLTATTLTFQTAGDAAKGRVGYAITICGGIDGTSMRAMQEGVLAVHSVLGRETITAVDSGANTWTLREGTRFVGVQVGDYVYVDVGYAVFGHQYTSAAFTTPWDFTIQDVTVECELYQPTLDNLGNANAAWDCATRGLYSTPILMGAGDAVPHRGLIEDCHFKGGSTQITATSGGANTRAELTLEVRSTEVEGGLIGIYFGSQDGYNKRKLIVSGSSYIHDTDATVGSHLIYCHSSASISCLPGVVFDGWRGAKFAIQHWGSSTSYNVHAIWDGVTFGSRGLGYAVLTSERGTATFSGCTFESVKVVQWRCPTRMIGCYIRPSAGGGVGIVNYNDSQGKASLSIVGTQWNLYNALFDGLGYTAIQIDLPLHITVNDCVVTAHDFVQGSANALVPGNHGTFLVLQAGSTGGKVTVSNLRGRFDQGAGVGNVGALLSATGTTSGAVELRNIDWISRGHVSGIIQLSGKTSSDLIEVYDSSLNTVSSTGKIFVGTGTLPVDVIRTRDVKTYGIGSTLSTRQRMQFGSGTGPDVVAAATTTLDPDYGIRRVTAAAPVTIDTIVLLGGTSLIAYDLAGFDVLFADANATVSTAGNVEVGRAAARGRARFTYDSTAAKLVVG